jgi:hypothetical protein
MSSLGTAALTVLFTVIFLVAYKFLINPQVILPATLSSMSKCPERWNYNAGTQMCDPAYVTSCLPFSPDAPTLTSVLARCNLAKTCGTSWSGACP